MGKQKYVIVGAFLIVTAAFCGVGAVNSTRGTNRGRAECREVGNRYTITADSPVYASSTIGVGFQYPVGYRLVEAKQPEGEYRPDIALYPTADMNSGPQLWIFYPTERDNTVNPITSAEAYSQDYRSTHGMAVRVHRSKEFQDDSTIMLRQHYDAAPFGKMSLGRTVFDITYEAAEGNFQRYVVIAGNQLLIIKGPRYFTFDEPEKGVSLACQEKEAEMLLDNIATTLRLTNRRFIAD